MTLFDDDLDTMFDDFPSVDIVCGTASGKGFKDVEDMEVLSGMERGVIGEGILLTFPTARFPDLVIGSALTVDGVAMKVRDRRRPKDYADGAVTCAWVVKA